MKKNTLQNFWDRVDKTNSCWNYNGFRDRDGYGIFKLDGKYWLTHRLSLHIAGIDIDDKIACHRCDNPSCVNPDHLFVGTQADNIRDMCKKGRNVTPVSKLSENDVLDIRSSTKSLSQLAKLYKISIPYASNIRNCIARKDVA
jgi:hypothetical protein